MGSEKIKCDTCRYYKELKANAKVSPDICIICDSKYSSWRSKDTKNTLPEWSIDDISKITKENDELKKEIAELKKGIPFVEKQNEELQEQVNDFQRLYQEQRTSNFRRADLIDKQDKEIHQLKDKIKCLESESNNLLLNNYRAKDKKSRKDNYKLRQDNSNLKTQLKKVSDQMIINYNKCISLNNKLEVFNAVDNELEKVDYKKDNVELKKEIDEIQLEQEILEGNLKEAYEEIKKLKDESQNSFEYSANLQYKKAIEDRVKKRNSGRDKLNIRVLLDRINILEKQINEK